jgi:hypothetical protein
MKYADPLSVDMPTLRRVLMSIFWLSGKEWICAALSLLLFLWVVL